MVWNAHAEAICAALKDRLPGTHIEPRSSDAPMPLRPDLRVLLAWKLPLGALKSLPNLAWVQLAGAGAEHFLHRDDLPVDTVLTRSPGRFGIQVAEYTLGYLLFFLLGLEQYRQDQRTRTWQPRPRPLLADCTIGVLGLGTLGSAIAERAATFGARVFGVCRRPRPMAHVSRVFSDDDWREMLPLCDALVIAAPLTPESENKVDSEALQALPRGATLINVARGRLVEEKALLESLRSGQLGAAVLDVFAEEPLDPDSPLWEEPRAWLTPHIAAPTENEPLADDFAANYGRFVAGQPLRHEVDRQRGY